jgi:transcription termination factor Rho
MTSINENNVTEAVAYIPQIINISDLREKSLDELHQIAKTHHLSNMSRVSKQDLLFALMKCFAKRGDELRSSGVLEIVPEQNLGYGFLRCEKNSFLAGAADIYVSPKQIKTMKLKSGDTISGTIRIPKGDERYFALAEIEQINFESPANNTSKISFKDLRAQFPTRWMKLERGNSSNEDVTAKILDIFCPLGFGQRMMIPAPPKAGKTVLLQQIADSISSNHPDAHLIVLLIDERPEEVTEMERTVKGTVIAATFDEPASRHIQVAEIVISKAKRLAEHGKDVVILLDSITRLARAYNTATPASGKILTGGVDANALQKPKRFFGAARDTVGAGSITIIATALIDTGSKMDEVIYEEFKGTGNSEVHLDREISQKRIFPAIDIERSGTRRDDKLVPSDHMSSAWALRKYLQTMGKAAGTEFLIERLKNLKTINEFFKAMKTR